MKRSMAIPACLLLAGSLMAFFVSAQEKPQASYQMTTYYVAFLRKGPKFTTEKTEESRKIQEAHMAHIQEMAASKKLLLAGPFSDDGDLRGMFVFVTDTIDEARALADADPGVKAGRFAIDIHPWFSAKGITIVQDAPAK